MAEAATVADIQNELCGIARDYLDLAAQAVVAER